MRPSEFTREDIIAAGEDLVASGRSVTGFALRQKVGGGNPNRLKAVWDEHQAGSTTGKAVVQIALPSELGSLVDTMQAQANAMLYKMAMEMHQKAFEAGESRLTEAMRVATEMRDQAEKEMADAAQTVEQLEKDLERVTKEGEKIIEKMNETITRLETELKQERTYAIRLEVEIATLKAQISSGTENAHLMRKVESIQAQMELLMVEMKPVDVAVSEPSANTKKKSSPKAANLATN